MSQAGPRPLPAALPLRYGSGRAAGLPASFGHHTAMTTATAEITQAAIVPADIESAAISRWEALAHDIAIASEEATHKEFDYRSSADNKAARSWVAQLRRLKGQIERARKDAKAVHLERGRAVDETAKTLERKVQGLIQPHEAALLAIEAEEQARIDSHQAVLGRIAQLAEGVATADEAMARLAELEAIDPSGLEEFARVGASRKAEAAERLAAIADDLRRQEAERAELEALRAEKAAREEAERAERIRQEGIEQERQRAAKEAAEREAQARRREQEIAIREAQAQAAADQARAAAEAAERRAAEAEAREAARLEAEAKAEAERLAEEAQRRQQMAARREQLANQIAELLAALSPVDATKRIIAGTLHPALRVDWSADW